MHQVEKTLSSVIYPSRFFFQFACFVFLALSRLSARPAARLSEFDRVDLHLYRSHQSHHRCGCWGWLDPCPGGGYPCRTGYQSHLSFSVFLYVHLGFVWSSEREDFDAIYLSPSFIHSSCLSPILNP